MIQNHHTHPITILENIWRFLFILLLPLARGFLLAIQGGQRAWLEGAWFDILMILLLLGLSTVEWYLCRYSFDQNGFCVTRGIFYRRQIQVPLSRVTTISQVRPFLLRPLGIVVIHADTSAGGSHRSDLQLNVSARDGRLILGVRDSTLNPVYTNRQYFPENAYIVFLAAFNASSTAGIAFLATFISQTGRLLGEQFADRIYGTFEKVTLLLAFGIPPAAAALAYLMLFGWLIAFLLGILRYKNLKLVRRSHSLSVSSGLLTLRQYCVAVQEINYLDLRCGLFTRLLGVRTLFIHAIGFGKHRDDISAIAVVHRKNVSSTLSLVLPEFAPSPRQLCPNAGAIFKFLNDAFWPCLLIPLAAWLVGYFFPDWAAFCGWIGLMLSLPAWYFMAVRITDFCTSGISREGDLFTLRYSHFFKLHTVVIPRERIARVCLRQSILQRGDDRCDVLIHSFSEGRVRHHIKNIDRRQALALFELEEPQTAES